MLRGWNAEEVSIMPDYYVMPLDADMPSVTMRQAPSREAIAACKWLTDEDIDFHAREFERTGWVGALKWYRCQTEGVNSDLDLYSGRTIDVPAIFISSASDWGVQQIPGGLERLQTQICTKMARAILSPGRPLAAPRAAQQGGGPDVEVLGSLTTSESRPSLSKRDLFQWSQGCDTQASDRYGYA